MRRPGLLKTRRFINLIDMEKRSTIAAADPTRREDVRAAAQAALDAIRDEITHMRMLAE